MTVYRLGGGDPDWSSESMIRRLIVNATGLFLASVLVSGIEIDDWQALLAGTAIFAIVNALLRPVAMLVSCCLVIFTFGLFVVVINGAMRGLGSAGDLDRLAARERVRSPTTQGRGSTCRLLARLTLRRAQDGR